VLTAAVARGMCPMCPCVQQLTVHLHPPLVSGLRDERDLSIAVRLGCGALAGTMGQVGGQAGGRDPVGAAARCGVVHVYGFVQLWVAEEVGGLHAQLA